MADIAHLTVVYESQGYDKVKGEVESLKQAGAQVEAASSKAATGTQRAGEAAAVAVGSSSQRVRALTQQMSGLERTVLGLGDVFKHAFGGLIAFGAVAAIAEFGRSIIDANRDMQKMLNTLNSASGSMSAAKTEFAFLSDLANKLGTDLQGSADGYARLAVSARAAGISTSQLHTSFTGLSEGFAATGRSGDEMNRFLVQMEQGLSQGTLQMRDLRAMAQSFPAAFEIAGEAAKRMGGSLDSFLKQGGLPAEQFFVTFSEIVHEKFAKAAEEASNTLVGQLNRIKNALFESKTGADALAPLTAAFKSLADELNSDSGRQHIQNLVKNIVEGFKAALAAVVALIGILPELISLLKLAVTVMLFRGAIAGVSKLVEGFVGLTKAVREFAAVNAAAGIGTAVAGEARRLGIGVIGARAAASAGLIAGGAEGAAAVGAAASAAILPVALLVAAIGGITYAIYKVNAAHEAEQAAFDKSIAQYKSASGEANDLADNINKVVDAYKGLGDQTGLEGIKAFGSLFLDSSDKISGLYNDLAKAEKQAQGLSAQLANMPNPSIAQISTSKEASGVLAEQAAKYGIISDRLKDVQSQVGGLKRAIEGLGSASDKAFGGFNTALDGVLSSMPSATASITAFNAQVAQSWLKVAQAALAATKSELAGISSQLVSAGFRLDAGETGARADADRALFEKGRKLLGDIDKLNTDIAAQEKKFGTGALSTLVSGLQKQADMTDKVAQYHATVKQLQETMAQEVKSGKISPENAKTLEALGEKYAKAILDKGNGSSGAQSAADRLLQSITERIQAEKLLQAEMEKSGGDVSKLTEGQKMLIKFNTELGTTYKGTTAAQAENIRVQLNGLIASEKATQAAKDHAAALKTQADALAEVNKIGNTAASKGASALGRAGAVQFGMGRTSNRGQSDAASMTAALEQAGKLTAKTNDAAKAYADASVKVKAYSSDLEILAKGEEAAQIAQQFMDSQDPSAQQERNIQYLQTYLGLLQNMTKEQIKAFDAKVPGAYAKQLSELPKIISQMKVKDAFSNTVTALRSMQSLTKEGSKSYKDMEKAIAVVTIAQQALATVKAVNAVLTQAEGDPYSAFFRMAAMAAAVAPLLSSIGAGMAAFGGGGGTPSEQSAEVRQAQQGTGTVLGDATKQSQSIANAVTLTADSTSKLVGINTGMRDALINLQKALESAGVLIAQGASSTSFPSFNKDVNPINGIISSLDILGGDPIAKAVSSFLFGGKKTLVDQGIEIMGGALNSMLNQVVVGAYQTIHKSGGLFGSSKTYDVTQAVSGDISTQFGLVMKSIVDTVTQAAKALGIPLGDIQQKIAAFQVATQHISLKGLSAEDQNKAIEAVFSKIFDDLAASVVPFVKQFQKVGEGMAETLVRVATDVQIMQRAVQTLGFAVTTSDPEKFAQVSVALVELMGGAQQFIDGMNSFISDFAPDTVKLQQAHDQLTAALKQVGLALPDTRDGMWKLMQSLDATTTAGQQQIAVLLQLADVSNNYYTMLEQGVGVISKAAQDLATKLYGSLGGSLDAISAKLDELKGKTQSALGVALGGNSPLSAQEQLNLALKGLASGLTTIDQVLAIGKKLYRGADYTKLYQQVMASQGMGTGGVGDVGAAVDQYNSLFAQQQALQKQQDAMGRFNDAKQLADYVVQMAKNQGKSYQDIATSLGFNLSGLGKDLGVSNIIGYLDKLTLEGAGTGKEQVAALNTLNSTANSQLTTLKSIDQRLRNIEDSNEKTATNTGKQASQGTTTALRHTASTTRMAAA